MKDEEQKALKDQFLVLCYIYERTVVLLMTQVWFW